jgi:uncharacterized membrane protein
MRGKNTLFSAAVVLLVLGSPVFAYRQVMDLGALEGRPDSRAYSINDKGQIVGECSYNGFPRACLFDSSGGGANIKLSSNESVAYSINNNGRIVGSIDRNGVTPNACIFDSSGGEHNIYIGTDTYKRGQASSINGKGQIVGIYYDSYYERACLFDSTGGGANILLGGSFSHANCINNNNLIVGYEYSNACIFDPAGPEGNILHDILLGTLPNYRISQAMFVNNNNQIVGAAYMNSFYSPDCHACLFDSTGGHANIDLGALNGSDYSVAWCINDIGQIVGTAYDGYSTNRACLFDSSGQGNNIDLNTLIDQSSGWILKEARSINNNGWIVGQGVHNGQTRAFLLTPEPATLLLFGAGITLLRRKK